MRTVLALLIVLFLTDYAIAEEEPLNAEALKIAMNNVSMEYVTCASYYAHAAMAVKNGGDQETSDSYANIYENVIVLAMAAAQIDRSQEMAMKVTTARLDIVMDEMQSEIENDYSNFSLLMQKYHQRCDFVVNNTEKFMDEWFDDSRSK